MVVERKSYQAPLHVQKMLGPTSKKTAYNLTALSYSNLLNCTADHVGEIKFCGPAPYNYLYF